jgi:hypothetical protein
LLLAAALFDDGAMRKIVTLTFIVLCMLYTGTASAITPSAGLLVGNGFKDGYNLGIGARAGVTLPMSVYVGGTFVYHLGKSEHDVTANLWYLGAEGGYDLDVGPLTIRPYLGLGYTHFMVSAPDVCLAGQCVSVEPIDGKFSLWPGATAIVGLGGWFVGADLRYVVVTGADDANALTAFATVGVSF